MQYEGQVRVSSGVSEVDVLIRKAGVDVLEEFQALRLSELGEGMLRAALGVKNIDYYNVWPRWFIRQPYGIIVKPDGTIATWWGPH